MRAILAAWDKTGIVDLGRSLTDLGWEVMSNGRTLAMLQDAGVEVLAVSDVIGVPEMLGGRVKTLHPAIHGAILANRSVDAHLAELTAGGIVPIDLVVCNFYPFTAEPSMEMVDIGGPAMVRAAAKNQDYVGVIVDPVDYHAVIQELAAGELSTPTRRQLARKAFAYTAAYDAAIVQWLDDTPVAAGAAAIFPETIQLSLVKTDDLRLGENPHQQAARYRFRHEPKGWWDTATQHHGIAMSYLNIWDSDAAWRLVHALGAAETPAAVIVKHGNPCGVALGDTVTAAWTRAHASDEVSAYGGIVAVNSTVPAELAKRLSEVYTLVIVAPDYDDDAMSILRKKRKNLRILTAKPPTGGRLHVRSIDGGLLVQTGDAIPLGPAGAIDRSGWSVVTDRAPTPSEWRDLELAWRIAARVASNSIVMVKDAQAVGIGASQQNRRDAGLTALRKANGRAVGGSCASDGFFPFRDGLDAVIEAGCTAVIQPGGSVRDEEVVAAANDAGLAMIFTGMRHFWH
jgi:phosphoribosylaminoimidazolecarboxamide formyltransferase/IMP cyclohydrolase